MAALSLICLLLAIGATEVERPAASEVPHARMQALAPLAGDWTMAMAMTSDGGATWQAFPTATVRFGWRMKELMLMESPVNPPPGGFHVETVFSWDQYRDVYRVAAMDDTWGLMDIYEGRLEDGKLTVDNVRSGTTFPVGEGVERHFRLAIPIHGDERTMVIDASTDGGQTWGPAFRVDYRRK
ncbi:MAG: hypothetical protein AAGE01_12860 [Pseudomonadota bacterium]